MKITIDLVEKIIEHEKAFHPRKMYCVLLDITDDTIRNWIAKGEELYTIDQGLFQIPKDIEEMRARKNYSNNELLIFLYDQIKKEKTVSALNSYDDMLKTGSKGSIKSFTAKTMLLNKPDEIIEVMQLTTSEFNNTPSKNNATEEISYSREYLENLAKTGKQNEEN